MPYINLTSTLDFLIGGLFCICISSLFADRKLCLNIFSLGIMPEVSFCLCNPVAFRNVFFMAQEAFAQLLGIVVNRLCVCVFTHICIQRGICICTFKQSIKTSVLGKHHLQISS